jgi:hypothetical protein
MRETGLIVIVWISILCTAQESPKALTPCKLLAHRQKYDKNVVRVSGYVEASYHTTVLASPDCKAAIALADSRSLPKDSLYGTYSEGVQAVRVKNESRKLWVVVEGRFNAALRRHGITGSQLVITRIVDAKFEGDQ